MFNQIARFTWVVAALFFLLPLLAKPASAQVTEVTLDNGLRVIVFESHAVPIVAVDAWVRAGTRRETQGQPGVAHFLEHLLFKGTPTHPDEESVDGTIEDLGGSLDAATSYDWAHFYTEVPATGYGQAISLLADILQHASLTSNSIEEERPIILDEISQNSSDPLTSMEDTVRGLIYTSDSAYSRSITGTADQVQAVTRDQIVAFYNTYYVPNNTTLVVSGDVNTGDVVKFAMAQFGAWAKSTTLPVDGDTQRSSYLIPTDDSSRIRKTLLQQDGSESYVVMGFPAPSVTDQPDAWDMDVLLTLLGQGGNNLLTTDLKIKGQLVNTIGADYLTQKDPGILTISASLPTANVQAVQDAILVEIKKLRTNLISDQVLMAAKNALKANYLFDVDTDSGHADSLGFYDCIDSYQYDVDYLKNIDAVTAADIQRIAQKYLDPESYAVVLQVPAPDVSTARAPIASDSVQFAQDRVSSTN